MAVILIKDIGLCHRCFNKKAKFLYYVRKGFFPTSTHLILVCEDCIKKERKENE